MHNFESNNYMSFTETTIVTEEKIPAARTSTGKHRSKGRPSTSEVKDEPITKVPGSEQYLPTDTATPKPTASKEAPISGFSSVREIELESKLARLQDEYSHYRKRVARDNDVAREATVEEVIASLFPVLDDIVASRNFGDLTEGPFASIASKLETNLERYGLERIDAKNVPFDPEIHEAVLRSPDNNVEEDYVLTVLREGYKRGEKTLRAAQVIVSAGKA